MPAEMFVDISPKKERNSITGQRWPNALEEEEEKKEDFRVDRKN